MTNLNTHIHLKYIKQSEKLQNILIKKYGHFISLEKLRIFPMSISDIIDNAEEFFGKKLFCNLCKGHHNVFQGKCMKNITVEYKVISNEILSMCQQNKSIEEISDYIIKNIIIIYVKRNN